MVDRLIPEYADLLEQEQIPAPQPGSTIAPQQVSQQVSQQAPQPAASRPAPVPGSWVTFRPAPQADPMLPVPATTPLTVPRAGPGVPIAGARG